MTVALGVIDDGPAYAGGACRGSPVTELEGTIVRMANNCFSPTILHVEPGATVAWTNDDVEPHTVSGANVAWGDYEELRPSESVSHRFTAGGAYPYYCFVHPGMIGAIVVGESGDVGDTSAVEKVAAGPVSRAGEAPATATAVGERGGGNAKTIGIATGIAFLVAAGTFAGGYVLARRRAVR